MQFRRKGTGLTLIELIVAFSILLILSTMALPLARVKVQREKERRLRDALTVMRKAIDRYKDMADAGKLGQIEPDTHGYPPNLEILVEGVTVQSTGMQGMQGNLGGQPGRAFGNQPQGGFGNSQRRALGSSSRSGRNRSGGGLGGLGGTSGRRGDRFGSRQGFGQEDTEQKIRFLRRIPVDPMTDSTDWGLRSVQDSPDSMGWGGQNVFDVYTRSYDTALDGTKYQDW